VEEYQLFASYPNLFKPILFDNKFNENLIRQLIENDHPELAEKYCLQQIKNNSRPVYNTLYFELLKEIYTLQKDES
jgi:hypothetical protein